MEVVVDKIVPLGRVSVHAKLPMNGRSYRRCSHVCRRCFAGFVMTMVCASCDVNSTTGLTETAGVTVNQKIFLFDLSGQQVDPLGTENVVATVFLFTRTDCPISNRYAPEVRRLFERYEPEGVEFQLIYVDPGEDTEMIRQHLNDYSYPCGALRDPDHRLVEFSGATRTPEAAVFTSGCRLAYRGRINDQYIDFGKARNQASTHDLADALDAILAGKAVAQPKTEAIGCYISDLR